VNAATLDGLDELGIPYPEAFARARIVGARPDALGRLAAAGIAAHAFVLCGPAVAIAPAPGAPAVVGDPGEWELGSHEGRITVTNLRPRATEFRATATAVRGALVDGGVVPEPEASA